MLQLNTKGENYNINVIHQLPQRMLREHIAKCFKEFLPELQVLDEDEMLSTIEREAELFEKEFFANIYTEFPVFDFEIN